MQKSILKEKNCKIVKNSINIYLIFLSNYFQFIKENNPYLKIDFYL